SRPAQPVGDHDPLGALVGRDHLFSTTIRWVASTSGMPSSAIASFAFASKRSLNAESTQARATIVPPVMSDRASICSIKRRTVPMPPHPCQQTAIEAGGALRLSSRREGGIMAVVLHDEAPCPTRGRGYVRRYEG